MMSETQLTWIDLSSGTPIRAPPSPQKKRKQIEPWIFEMMDAICSPVIVFQSSWKESIPESVLADIKVARLLVLMKQEKTATIPEALAYLYPATMEMPLNSHWANVYLWVCGEYLRQHKKAEKPFDFLPESLDDYEMSLLKQLRNWIYEKRRRALRERL